MRSSCNYQVAPQGAERSSKMNRVEKLNEELKRRGAEFTVREHEKWVNGVYYKGLMLWSRQNNINPIIYDAEILMDAELDTAVDKLIHFHEMTAEPPIEYEEMMNPDWFRKHLTIRLYSSRAKEHFTKEQVVYQNCLDMALALYVFIPCSDEYSECEAAVHYDVLEELELTEQEAFEIAKKNIEKEVVYSSMELMMEELLTGKKIELNEVDEEGMNVLTNTKRMYGAVGILAESMQKKLEGKWILPSSVHECIVISDDIPLDICREMVKEVNDTGIKAEEILSYQVYCIRDGKLMIA